MEDGLSQSHINAIYQDSQGFIWFGTNGGLNRFDGIDFKVFRHNSSDSNSIAGNVITCLLEDENETLWIGTKNGLSAYDKKKTQFSNYLLQKSFYDGATGPKITSLLQDSTGTIWVGSQGMGLFYFNSDTLSKIKLPTKNISSLTKDNNGIIWVGTFDHGLFSIARDESGNYTVKEHGLNDVPISSALVDKDGMLWVGTQKGLYRVRHLQTKNHIVRIEHVSGQFGKSSAMIPITCMYQGKSGLLWLGSENSGLYSYNKFSGSFSNYKVNPNTKTPLLSNMVTALFDDSAGILWIGTNAGVNKIDRQTTRFNLIVKEPGNLNSLSSNNIQSVVKENNGALWIGTFDGGLNYYNPKTKDYTTILSNDIIESGTSHRESMKILQKKNQRRKYNPNIKRYYLSNNRVHALQMDNYGYIWAGTGGGGLNRINRRNQQILHYKARPDHEDSLKSDVIKAITIDNAGHLWLGTEGGGLSHFDRKKFKTYTYNATADNSISSNDILSLVFDKNGLLWIGTSGRGLCSFDPQKESFTTYQYSAKDDNSLSSNTVFNVFVDSKNQLWVGTAAGLNLMTHDGFIRFNAEQGLPSDFVYSILEDADNFIWLSTSNGLSKLNPETGEIKNYDRKDGLQGNEFNPSSAFKANDTELYFGGLNGLNVFNPKLLKDNNFIPPVVITDFRLLNEEVPVGTGNSPLAKHISYTDELVLNYDDVAISFEFAALSYTDAEKNQYAYIMENFDEKWNYAGNRRYANYTNLAPGEYVFRVKGSNNDNIWNEEGVSVKIKILPPFWRTWWFYLFVIALLAGVWYLILRFRVHNLQESKRKLHQEVAARTSQVLEEKSRVEKANAEVHFQKMEAENQRNLVLYKNKELSEARDKINEALQELQRVNSGLESIVTERTSSLLKTNEALRKANEELDTFIYRASHDLKGPISRLQGLALVGKMEVNTENYRLYLEKVDESAARMHNILGKLMNIHDINNCQITPEVIDIDLMINEISSKFALDKDPRNINIRTTYHAKRAFVTDKILIKLILENLLENSLVFKIKETINIDIDYSAVESGFLLGFSDDGIGLDNDQHEKIFNMFYRGSELSIGNGLGLYLVKKALEKLNGSVLVESTSEVYTRFNMTLPFMPVPHKTSAV
ncbi:MAG: two-component regulator propeller domain-containing protein [Cyclobacteriaceae bacterium]